MKTYMFNTSVGIFSSLVNLMLIVCGSLSTLLAAGYLETYASIKTALPETANLSVTFTLKYVKQDATASGASWEDAIGELQSMINPAAGTTHASLWIDGTTPEFVQRHPEITPEKNASTVRGEIYFTIHRLISTTTTNPVSPVFRRVRAK
jgi:hypothetical protein